MKQYPRIIFYDTSMEQLKTPLYEKHIQQQAKIVDFANWLMPIHYGSQLEEHLMVRQAAGMFDVSHMTIIDISGVDARAFLRYLLANDVAKLEKSGVGKALYSAMLNEKAGIVDDLIVYLMPEGYRLVVNAGTRTKDLQWIQQQAQTFHVKIQEQNTLAIIAVQGPKAISHVKTVRPNWGPNIDKLKAFQAFLDKDWLIARTGYTGEDGVEIICPATDAPDFWEALLKSGVKPCGLGARDTLRLEAGMNLYGHDMNDTIHPYECGLAWTIDLQDSERNFCGKASLLEKIEIGIAFKQVGLILEDKGILREGLPLQNANGEFGLVTSGTFSPSLKLSLAIARVPVRTEDKVLVELRGELKSARVVQLPFIRLGKKIFE